mgnify:CR=1 FL=1
MAAGDNRGHGGNTGYDDQFDAYYSWDDQVPNHKNLSVGDPIALWDKERLLGVSMIETIEATRGPKLQNRCPACNKTRISERTRREPRWRCSKCGHEFDTPHSEVIEVDRYTARYDAAWTSLDGLLSRGEIQSLQEKPGDINAMRPLDWTAFSNALVVRKAGRAIERVAARVDLAWQEGQDLQIDAAHGFASALVRVRRGQRRFRQQLLASQGRSCAFTGGAPTRVLEAGHLYSYAQVGVHEKHGGLMLRRDIHRLFDDGLLAVNPSTLQVDVGSELEEFPQYARLHEQALTLPLLDRQVEWLEKHWLEHRSASTEFSG